MGTLLEIKGELVFKVRAYYKAADNIEALSEDIETIRKENRLGDIPGIGKALEEKIGQYLDTGKIKAYQDLAKEIPESVLDVMNIPSVGPKKAKLFFDKLKIKTVEDLKSAAESGKLLNLEGFKEKAVENILRGIKIVQEGQERMNLGTATRLADAIMQALKQLPEVKHIETAGSLRRGRETIGDIDILIDSPKPAKVMDAFVHLPQVESVNAFGETKSSVLVDGHKQVDLRVVNPSEWGAALLYFTGSKSFNIKLRQLAIKKNLKVNEYGVFKVSGEKETRVACATEEECFKALGLPFVPPELREEIGEERIFQGEKLPRLIEEKDICGEIHVHSTYSDGRNTIDEMVAAARQRGYSYLAISDHSPRLRVAGGVSPEDLKRKKKEIETINKRLKDFRVLFGTEVEIDTEGDLDYNDKILSEFDIVIAAIHSGFEQDTKKLTARLLKACQHKYVNVIAHPFGVHLGKREPYNVDFKAVCQAAVDHRVLLEINSFPVRLDLNSANAYFAKAQGVQFVINTDAHHVGHLDYMKFGIKIARRAWLTKEDVANTKPLKDFIKTLEKS